MYRAGPLALADLEAQIGRAAFRTFLRRYMAEPVRTTPQMLDLVADVAGEDARDWFVARLGE
jgi:aminopeptidase N